MGLGVKLLQGVSSRQQSTASSRGPGAVISTRRGVTAVALLVLMSGAGRANVLCEDSEAFKMITGHAESMFMASRLGLSESRSPQD